MPPHTDWTTRGRRKLVMAKVTLTECYTALPGGGEQHQSAPMEVVWRRIPYSPNRCQSFWGWQKGQAL
jgi:hypothetical protein